MTCALIIDPKFPWFIYLVLPWHLKYEENRTSQATDFLACRSQFNLKRTFCLYSCRQHRPTTTRTLYKCNENAWALMRLPMSCHLCQYSRLKDLETLIHTIHYHSNLTKKLKFTAAKLSWFTVTDRRTDINCNKHCWDWFYIPTTDAGENLITYNMSWQQYEICIIYPYRNCRYFLPNICETSAKGTPQIFSAINFSLISRLSDFCRGSSFRVGCTPPRSNFHHLRTTF